MERTHRGVRRLLPSLMFGSLSPSECVKEATLKRLGSTSGTQTLETFVLVRKAERFTLERPNTLPLFVCDRTRVEEHIDTHLSRMYPRGMERIERTIRLSEQDVQALTTIREKYGLPSDSEAIRFALHTMWRDSESKDSPTQAPNKERPS